MPSNHLILCRPLLLLPLIFPSIRVFSNESALCIRWPKYWSFSLNISPSNVHPGLISFRMDWLDLLAVQGTLKSLLQHHNSKASILQCSAFFIVQLSLPYMTTGKTIASTRPTFIDKVMSLLLNMLSRVITLKWKVDYIISSSYILPYKIINMFRHGCLWRGCTFQATILHFTDRETKGLSCQRTTGIKQQNLDLKLHFFDPGVHLSLLSSLYP